jgi:hypothetical protein
VEGGRLGEEGSQLVGVGAGDVGRIQAAPHALLQVQRTAEGALQRYLLVERHPYEQGQRIPGQELVGGRVAGED